MFLYLLFLSIGWQICSKWHSKNGNARLRLARFLSTTHFVPHSVCRTECTCTFWYAVKLSWFWYFIILQRCVRCWLYRGQLSLYAVCRDVAASSCQWQLCVIVSSDVLALYRCWSAVVPLTMYAVVPLAVWTVVRQFEVVRYSRTGVIFDEKFCVVLCQSTLMTVLFLAAGFTVWWWHDVVMRLLVKQCLGRVWCLSLRRKISFTCFQYIYTKDSPAVKMW